MGLALYFDMTSGFAGDMGLASVIQLGADENVISTKLSELLKFKVELSINKVYRNAISAGMLIIKADAGTQTFRGLEKITAMIKGSSLSDNVKSMSLKTFNIIAEAEALVHGIDVKEVHFHEIGAVDTIVDIVGFFIGLELLGIDKVFASKPIFGYGTIKTEHGLIPLPAPATVKILKDVECRNIDVEGEFTTPTGASILKSSVERFTDTFDYKIINDVYSTGSHEFEGATNLLRAIIVDLDSGLSNKDSVIMIETNIDKMTGEEFGSLYDRLMQAGALDVVYTPIFMKKNRPAYKLSVMINEDNKPNIIRLIFKYSATIGLRVYKVDRAIMKREIVDIDIADSGKVRAKKSSYDDIIKHQPEWSDIVSMADKLGISEREAESIVIKVIQDGK